MSDNELIAAIEQLGTVSASETNYDDMVVVIGGGGEISAVVDELAGIVVMSEDVGSVSASITADAEVVNDHALLVNRELENQHPIEAITDLEDTLEELDSEAITYQFINQMMEN